ncbi:MAG: spore maturation protein [Bacillota bacterium]|nr:spore maturation protein [Bacillota bacterium]
MAEYVIICFLGLVAFLGILGKKDIYQAFLKGAKEGLASGVKIFAPIVAIMTAMRMLQSSGALDFILKLISPFTNFIGMPSEVAPLALMRPLSGSASIAMLEDALERFGPDSLSGHIASVIMGSTETTFYIVSVYFGVTRVKNIRHTLVCALLADLTGIITGIIVCKLLS